MPRRVSRHRSTAGCWIGGRRVPSASRCASAALRRRQARAGSPVPRTANASRSMHRVVMADAPSARYSLRLSRWSRAPSSLLPSRCATSPSSLSTPARPEPLSATAKASSSNDRDRAKSPSSQASLASCPRGRAIRTGTPSSRSIPSASCWSERADSRSPSFRATRPRRKSKAAMPPRSASSWQTASASL